MKFIQITLATTAGIILAAVLLLVGMVYVQSYADASRADAMEYYMNK